MQRLASLLLLAALFALPTTVLGLTPPVGRAVGTKPTIKIC